MSASKSGRKAGLEGPQQHEEEKKRRQLGHESPANIQEPAQSAGTGPKEAGGRFVIGKADSQDGEGREGERERGRLPDFGQ